MDDLTRELAPTPYHVALSEYLRRAEPELWRWFEDLNSRSDSGEALRLELLKTTCRLDRADYTALYEAADAALLALGLDAEVFCYQSTSTGGLNASIACPAGEAHIVFTGNLLGLLSPEELRAVLGHELAHYLLWREQNGVFKIADQLIHAAVNDFRSEPVHEQSARLLQLYTEIYADRGAWRVTADLPTTVAALVKVATGLPEINGNSYLRQAEDIFAKGPVQSQGLSHPETYVRARALAIWVERGEDAESDIQAMIEGTNGWETLDVVGQVRLTQMTRRMLGQMLRPEWIQTPAVLAHAKTFFPDFSVSASDDPDLDATLRQTASKFPDYFSAVLLDFATVDPDIRDRALSVALEWSDRCEMAKAFEKFAAKELDLKLRDLKKLRPKTTGSPDGIQNGTES